MKRYVIGLASLLLVATGSAASAETMSFAHAGALIARSCGPSIERFCSNVNIGTGEMMACLRRNQNRVPANCFADMSRAQAGVDARLAAQASTFRLCEASTRQLCAGVQPGDAYILNCLIRSQRVVRPACRQALIDSGWK